jgi:hypothetical protein
MGTSGADDEDEGAPATADEGAPAAGEDVEPADEPLLLDPPQADRRRAAADRTARVRVRRMGLNLRFGVVQNDSQSRRSWALAQSTVFSSHRRRM